MHARKLFARTVFLSAVFTLTVAHAYAGDWSAPVAGRGIITPYGVMCPSGTHRGVDVAGAEGAEVHAPMAGTVVFSGQVPADCGGTCGAITIELDDGRKLSLLPFASMTVSAGDELSPGEPIGTLAAEGDDSAAEAHLHIGLRSGTCYLDPSGLITEGVSGDAPQPDPAMSPENSDGSAPGAGSIPDARADAGSVDTPQAAAAPDVSRVPATGTVSASTGALSRSDASSGAVAAQEVIPGLDSGSVSPSRMPHLSSSVGQASARAHVLIGDSTAAAGPGSAADLISATSGVIAGDAGVSVAAASRMRAAGVAVIATGIGIGSSPLLAATLLGALAVTFTVAARRGATATIQ